MIIGQTYKSTSHQSKYVPKKNSRMNKKDIVHLRVETRIALTTKKKSRLDSKFISETQKQKSHVVTRSVLTRNLTTLFLMKSLKENRTYLPMSPRIHVTLVSLFIRYLVLFRMDCLWKLCLYVTSLFENLSYQLCPTIQHLEVQESIIKDKYFIVPWNVC